MSQANVEIVREFLDAEVDEALTYADPEIVWNPIEELPTGGHDAVRTSLARWKAEWDDYKVLPEDLVDMGDRVLATVRLRARGRGSGVEIDALFYDLYTLADGKIVRMDQFTERSEALAALGNAAVVRRAYDAFNRGDLDGLMECYATDAQQVVPVIGEIHQGREQIKRSFADYFELVEAHHTEPIEFIAVGEHVVVPVRLHGRLRHTGITDEMIPTEMVHAFEVRDDKIVWNYICADRDEAIQAAESRA
jgi:ketosteroid isomerase-like protein